MWSRGPALAQRESDPLGAYRTLLFHADGSNGSTTFTDSSLHSNPATVVGNPVISTSAGAFGGAEFEYYRPNSSYIFFTKTGGFVDSASNAVWTIEFVFTYTTTSTTNTAAGCNTIVGVDNGGAWTILVGAYSTGIVWRSVQYGGAFTVGTRYHLMFACDGANVHIYVNGSRVGTPAAASVPSHTKFLVGDVNTVFPGSNSYSHGGKIDELRITSGLCLQNGASYAIQTEAFLNP